jgi:hypothetical protein
MRWFWQLASHIKRILDQISDKRVLQYVLNILFPYILETHFKGPVSDPCRGQKQIERMLNFSRHYTHC